jgi:hypothetical protein
MDLTRVTEKDIQEFASHLSGATKYSQRMVAAGIIPAKNPIHVMLSQLNDELEKHSNNIVTMIESDQDLRRRINEFRSVDNEPLVKFALEQIKQKAADVAAARVYVIKTRQIFAGIEFVKKEPNYSNAWINEVNKNDRIGFMLRNANYPLDGNSVKNYLALYIYQTKIAPITD